MKNLLVLAALAIVGMVAGCTTLKTNATYTPMVNADGNAVAILDPATGLIVGVASSKSITQRATVTIGGKLKEGMFDFAADSVAADGSNWSVKSGTKASGASSPDIVKEVGELAVKAFGMGIAARAAAPPKPPATVNPNLSALLGAAAGAP